MSNGTQQQTPKKPEKIRFQLRSNKLIWESPSGNIKLNALKQSIGGEVSAKDVDDYNAVRRAIQLQILEKVNDKDKFREFEEKELTTGSKEAERLQQIKKKYNTEDLLSKRQDDVLKEIDEIKDPHYLIALIQNEKAGKNETKVERRIVTDALRNKLNDIDQQGIYEFEGDI